MSRDMQSVLERVVDALVANYQPERIVLFGSYAYGEPKATSDIDLLILKETDKSFSKRWAEVSELVADGRIYKSREDRLRKSLNTTLLAKLCLRERF